VSAGTLLGSLRADTTGMNDRASRPGALRTPSCAQGFAVAAAVPDGQHETAQILFTFDPGNSSWHPLNVGSADLCTGFVPAEIAAQIPSCA
jgi:hypothetical protein